MNKQIINKNIFHYTKELNVVPLRDNGGLIGTIVKIITRKPSKPSKPAKPSKPSK